MIFRQFKCYECGKQALLDFPNHEAMPKEVNCDCGGKLVKMLCSNFYVDHWTPMTNNAQADIEHFEKKAVKDGKYVSNKCAYQEDRAKKDIPMNISEV